MEPALQRRVQRYGWDKAAAYYEDTWQQQLKPAHDLLFEMAQIQNGQRIIDVACGTGLISFRAAETAGPDGFVLGTDISDKMIGLAQGISEINQMPQVRFERMDAEDLKIDDESFDLALCALGLMYAPNPLKALEEMHRVLEPGGRCISAVWGKRSQCGWADLFDIVDKRVSSEVCPMFFQLGNDLMLQKNFEAAGFSNIEVQRIQVTLDYESEEAACSAAFEGGPVALAYFKFPENVQKEAHEEYLASIEPFRTGKAYAIPGEFVVASGVK